METRVCFTLEAAELRVPAEALRHFGALAGESEPIELAWPLVTADAFGALCALAAQPSQEEATELGLTRLVELARTHAYLELAPALWTLVCDALLHCLQALDARALDALGEEEDMVPEEPEAPLAPEDFFTAEQRATRDRASVDRLCALARALLVQLRDTRLTRLCMARLCGPRGALEALAQELQLSAYMLRVVYDFVVAREPLRLSYVVCTSPTIAVVNAALYADTALGALSEGRLLRALLRAEDARLARLVRRGELSREARDWAMVRHFLGWGVTQSGHALYLYYRGPSSRSAQDYGRVENWAALPHDALRFFHTRLPRDTRALLAGLGSCDVCVTPDGARNLGLDVRYLAHRWAAQHPAGVARLRQSAALLAPRADDCLIRRQQQQQVGED